MNETFVVYNQTLVPGNYLAPNGFGPFWITVNDTSGLVFVSDSGGDAVSIVSPSSETVVGSVPVGSSPNGLAYDPSNGEVYVANAGSDNVSVIGDPGFHVVASIPVGREPMGVAYDPANQRVYVSNWGSGNISVINGSTNRVMGNIPVGGPVGGMAYDAANGRLFVADYVAQTVGGPGTVSVVDPSTDRLVANVSLGLAPTGVSGTPFDVVYDSANQELYVSEVLGFEIAVVNGTSDTVTADVNFTSIGFGDSPFGLTFDPTNDCLYVADWNASGIAVLNATTNRISAFVGVGSGPLGVEYDPVTGSVYVAASSTNVDGPDWGGTSDSSLTVLNSSSNKVVASVTLAAEPDNLAVDGSTHDVWVTDSLVGPSLLNGTTHRAAARPALDWAATAAAYDPENGNLYFTTEGDGPLLVVDGATEKVVRSIWFGGGLADVVVDPSNNWIYVSQDQPVPGFVDAINATTDRLAAADRMIPYPNQPTAWAYDDRDGLVFVADYGLDRITAIDGASGRIVVNYSLGEEPNAITYDAANGKLYVSESGENLVVAVDPQTGRTLASIPVGVHPLGMAYDTSDGDLYVADRGSGNVSVIDGSTDRAIGSIPVGHGPVTVAVDDSTGEIYVANYGSGTVSIIDPPTRHAVTFSETGLPAGTEWSVALDGLSGSSNTTSIFFAHSNGSSVPFRVGGAPGFIAAPPAGSIVVSGGATSETIRFARDLYTLWFNETGLPGGTNWSIALDSHRLSSSNHSIDFTEPNGTYPYSIAPIAGYATAWSGTASVRGTNVALGVLFDALSYNLTFTETGLPIPMNWSITIAGVAHHSDDGSLVIPEPNGTYPYAVGSGDPTHRALGGTLTVNGSDLSETVVFARVTSMVAIAESGLPTGTGWSLEIGGSRFNSTTSGISFAEPNGTYSYAIGSTDPTYRADGGDFTVDGGPVSENVSFHRVTWQVEFTESGLPADTNWSMRVGGLTQSSSTATIAFAEANGTYSFSVASVHGLAAASSAGAIVVSGGPLRLTIHFMSIAPRPAGPTLFDIPASLAYSILGGGAAAAVVGAWVILANRRRGTQPPN